MVYFSGQIFHFSNFFFFFFKESASSRVILVSLLSKTLHGPLPPETHQ